MATESRRAREMLDALRAELMPGGQTPPNRFIALLTKGAVPRERLAWLAAEQHHIINSDQRSFSALATRFPQAPAGPFFLGLAQGEIAALDLLPALIDKTGPRDLAAYVPKPLAQTYPHFLAWCALSAPASAVAMAMAANLEVWGSYCSATGAALRGSYGLGTEAVAFFDFFSTPPDGFTEQAVDVAQAGLDGGEEPETAVRTARAMQAYELAFWDALAEGL
ncbi:MAG: transcriptional regulator [Streptosporangiales bacterium]|nr:transcriptional regulator [Streptosporangiales bacterium]